MKASGHPVYYPEAKVTCACGNAFITGSTKPEIRVEICAKCHPFFTGEMRFVDTLGRVERFQQKQALHGVQGKQVSKKQKKMLKKQQEDAEESARPKTIREMLEKVKTKA